MFVGFVDAIVLLDLWFLLIPLFCWVCHCSSIFSSSSQNLRNERETFREMDEREERCNL